jgi:5-methylcytosine-specific restriction enzyme A
MTGRSIPEWIGKTPDSKIPPRVKLRIWERYEGRCHITKRKTDRIRKRHLGIKKPRTITAWRRFNKEIRYAGRDR